MEDFILEVSMFALALGISIVPFYIKDPIANKPIRIIVLIVVCILTTFGIKNAYNKYQSSEKAETTQLNTETKLNEILRSDSVMRDNYHGIKTALDRANLKYDSTSRTLVRNETNNYFGIVPRKVTERQIVSLIDKSSLGHAKDIGKEVKIMFYVYGSLSEDAEIMSVKRQIIAIVKKLQYFNIDYETHFFEWAPEPDSITCEYTSIKETLCYKFIIPFVK